ncbi:MAG: hypothetical protein A2275_17045 [Bacteroidetes bacterium RIFOXYA12_FULL_35_11]|nr:MAG: hypothetical protein A2X01_18180 [Bacteroidetes bacterium GWF2_35_48]OFY83396.1 MAG: hypothetical protein A2275_17045 [Bacteroidetes bacterium RIFOXYA12_FULL_35_11]
MKKTHLLDDLEKMLNQGITDSSLIDPLFEFYKKTPMYDYTSMHKELLNKFLEIIIDFEASHTGVVVDKEKLYFFKTLNEIVSSNFIGAISSWELSINERQRINGGAYTFVDIINELPENSIKKPIKYNYTKNQFLDVLIKKYPRIIKPDFFDLFTSVNGVDAIGLLACGLKNVQVSQTIIHYNNVLEFNRMFGQEIINSLCIINESIIKDYPEVATTITNPKERQIGKMLSSSTLGVINPVLSGVLGQSTSGYSGLYSTYSDMFDRDNSKFDIKYPQYLAIIESGSLTDIQLKAHILLGIHSLRNKVLHDFNDTLCYYSNATLFLKTIGLLLAGISITPSLR